MSDTVMEFIRQMQEKSDDAIDRGEAARIKEDQDPTKVFLSEELFERLLRERGIEKDGGTVTIDGIEIMIGKHSEAGTDFTIKVSGYSPFGYSSTHYGLR